MKLIRIHELVKRLGLSRTTIWRMERGGRFPPRIRTSARLVAWNEADIEAWLAKQPRGLAGGQPRAFIHINEPES